MIISISANQLSINNVLRMIINTVAGHESGYHGGSNHCHSLCSRWIKANDVGTVQFFGKDGIVYHSIVTVEGKIECDSLKGKFDAQGTYSFIQHDQVTIYNKIYDVPVTYIKKEAEKV